MHALGTALLECGAPEYPDDAKTASEMVLMARDRIAELQACTRKLCPEIEARKMLSFAAAEEIFSEPRRDN